MAALLDQYDALDIIGNGSFGIIRKVKRKTDGLIFARKELNFERMSERDRKQIVSEVNILKDLHHDNIVRYHDRHVDRDAGILYILMEYCGGGDLSTIIHQALKHNRPIPEDTVWNYFSQILLALHHCHHPNGHGRSGSGSSGASGSVDTDGKDRRAQILHRDLKPDNVFLDASHTVKLGDFGLSKALSQASFANTYVGTPYYMSPELMQEKAYDSKSDIWSLGCLIYELCALKPPFHEAKTHAELSIFIRNGRIPPLPRGYSHQLSAVIKAMLNLNPAMRPSAAQLLQHERLELVLKVTETEKMLTTVKTHKAKVVAQERDLHARETAFSQRETQLHAHISAKDAEITSLRNALSVGEKHCTEVRNQHQQLQMQHHALVREAVLKREEELRVNVMKREGEVAAAMVRREEEIMEAVRKREAELVEAWRKREEEVRGELREKVDWCVNRAEELTEEAERLEAVRKDLDEREIALGKSTGRTQKVPLEEVKDVVSHVPSKKPPTPLQHHHLESPLETPVGRRLANDRFDFPPSAMKGVVLTATGEPLATPAQGELAKLFVNSPKIGLEFGKIFDTNSKVVGDDDGQDTDEESPPPSPCIRKSSPDTAKTSVGSPHSPTIPSARQSRLRRPSLIQRAPTGKSSVPPSSVSDPSSLAFSSSKRLPTPSDRTHHPSASIPDPASSAKSTSTRVSKTKSKSSCLPSKDPSPQYDLDDEENLPSPFLKRVDRERVQMRRSNEDDIPSPFLKRVERAPSTLRSRRPSDSNQLLKAAATNLASTRTGRAVPSTSISTKENIVGGATSRPSVANARKAGEEARKALLRP